MNAEEILASIEATNNPRRSRFFLSASSWSARLLITAAVMQPRGMF